MRADGSIVDAERGGELGQARLAAGGVEAQAAALAEQQVLEHAEGGYERGVLVDHADAEAERRTWRVDADVAPGDADAPGVGLRHTGQHAHERRLPGAVLAQQAVHLARPDGRG